MRSRVELDKSRKAFDLVVWVDASHRLPPESAGSMELTADDADWVLDNNSGLKHLRSGIVDLVTHLHARRGAKYENEH